MKDLARSHRTVMKIDIDEHYSLNVKALYAAIVSFYAQVQKNSSPDHAEQLLAYRNAGQHVIEAVKAIKHMNKNVCRNLNSPNPDIREEYDFLRHRVGLLLRDIGHLNSVEGEDRPLAMSYIEHMRSRLERNDALASGHIESLIRNQKISPEMATSLMNDSSYTETVIHNLLSFAALMFKPWDKAAEAVEQEFELTPEERQEIREKQEVAEQLEHPPPDGGDHEKEKG
jgi:phosphate:Na+ symporter